MNLHPAVQQLTFLAHSVSVHNGGLFVNLGTHIHDVSGRVGIAKQVSRSEIKVEVVTRLFTYNGGNTHFDHVTSTFDC